MTIVIHPIRCNGCEACLDACPQGAISMNERTAEINESLCIHCETCVEACPEGAIESLPRAVEKTTGGMVIKEPVRFEAEARLKQPAAGATMNKLGMVLATLGKELLPVVFDSLFTRLGAWQENNIQERSTQTAIVERERCGKQEGRQIRLRRRRKGAGKRKGISGGSYAQ